MTSIIQQHIRSARSFIKTISRSPRRFRGRGIVICGGGDTYFPSAWVCIKMLRYLKCRMPIQLWYLGRNELSPRLERFLKHLHVECINALEVRKTRPCRILNGYELKSFALLYSSFKEILLLDADNIPVANPDELFKLPQYKNYGALFWPRPHIGPPHKAWEVFDVPYRAENAFDTGQLLVNKAKVWKALRLALWYNEHSDFYYKYVDGEKETFHLAFRKQNIPYALINTPPHVSEGTLFQHDFNGVRFFQHRKSEKWKLNGLNKRVTDFRNETKCFQFIEELRKRLAGRLTSKNFKRSRIVLRCSVDGFTGYGLHAQQIIKDFDEFGCCPEVLPIRVDEPPSVPIPQFIKDKFIDYSDANWELLLHPPDASPTKGKKTIFFTMWESTRLSPSHLENLKKATVIVVPCEWNANTFNAQGIDVPIVIAPLGIDEQIFCLQREPPLNQCVFGAAGNSHISGPTRKGLDDVIRAFQLAFPKEKDVALKVKTLPNSFVTTFNDPRIRVFKGYFSQNELAEWYSSLTCFVSAAKAEAWGLMQHQAMAVGRPVIACHYGGLREFFDSTVGYCINYTLEPADERYSGLGIWAKPSLDSLVEHMRRVYHNRGEADQLGTLAHKRAHQFTWKRANRHLLSVIRTTLGKNVLDLPSR